MAAKPWDNKSIDALSDMTPPNAAKKYRKNNISKRRPAAAMMTDMLTQTSSSDPSSDLLYDGTTTTSNSSSSLSNSSPPEEEGRAYKPNYMNPTESIKAKQRGSPLHHHHQGHNIQMHSSVDNLNLKFYNKSSSPVPSSRNNIINRTSAADSDLYSVRLCKDLYPPLHF